METARSIKSEDLTVRDIERIAKKLNENKEVREKKESHKRSSFYDEVELALNEHLSRKVRVLNSKGNGGTLEIEFYSEDDLGELAKFFNKE